MKYLIGLASVVLISIGFTINPEKKPAQSNNSVTTLPASSTTVAADSFEDYWYSGKAEIASYTLSQSRYGQQRDGKATLIFVTEPFSRTKQVKADSPSSDDVPVMKVNYLKKFATGIYPYSIMLSSFTEIGSGPKNKGLFKATFSSQEWCGQLFSQMSKKGDAFEISSFSYFEADGDLALKIPQTLTEDELWAAIRINPEELPVGNVEIVPSLYHLRLDFKPYKAQSATATYEKGEHISTYELAYQAGGRNLRISFETAFPHKILEWTEVSMRRDKQQVSTAKLDNDVYLDYWNYNDPKFNTLRDSLGLLY